MRIKVVRRTEERVFKNNIKRQVVVYDIYEGVSWLPPFFTRWYVIAKGLSATDANKMINKRYLCVAGTTIKTEAV